MDTLSYKTSHPNKASVDKNWLVVDASQQILGRLASEVAKRIRGKHKASFSPHVDCGDNVIVINSDQIRLTGSKWDSKEYIRHTGFPGGQRRETPNQVKDKSSTIIIEKAVRGMLPKNRLGREIFKNLHIYEGTDHPHEAQKPIEVKL